MRCWLVLLLGWAAVVEVRATFSSRFLFFLEDQFGRAAAETLARTDIGFQGSFGGGQHQAGKRTKHDPVVFVHGYTGYADDFANQVAFMKMQGYGDAELYGTTYGEKVDGPAPGQARPSDRQVRMNQTGMACEYVRAVRLLVQAVHRFTNRTVNLVGVSMGGAVTRKAVLGGRCVESGAELGPPLTALINNYLGVIGVQKGAAFCQHCTERACNSVTGMRCGSRFLRDINSRSGYEGRRRFVLESTGDVLVGYEGVCGEGRPSEFEGATQIIRFHGFDHTPTYRNSFQVQYMLISEQF